MRLFPIFFLITFISFGQIRQPKERIKDSIIYYLKNSDKKDKHKSSLRAIALSKEIKNDTLLFNSLINYGLANYSSKDTTGLKKAFKQINQLFKRNKDSFVLAKEQHFKALFFRIQYRLDSSYYYYHKSKSIYKELEDSLEVGKRLLSMGYMQNDEKDYIGAQVTIVEALNYLEPLNEIINTGDCYNILGTALANAGEYEEARKYYKKSREVFSKSTDERFRKGWELYLINNIGYSYLLDKKYKEAKKYFKKGLNLNKIEIEYPNHYQILLGNYSDCIYELGEKKEALENYAKILKLREKEGNFYKQSLLHNGFAHFYGLEGKKTKALYHAKQGYKLAKKVNNNFTKLSVLKKLANLTYGADAKKYFNEYAALSDSLNNRERYLKNQFAKVRYETEKKDKENVGLKLENSQKQAELKSERFQKIIGWLFSIAALLLLVLSITYFRNRRKKLIYEAQLQKATAREEERQQIAKSLHDEVAGDLRMLHQKLERTDLGEETKSIEKIKENVRNLSHQLSSVDFDEVSFKDQILNLVSDYFTPSFRISVEGIDDIPWKEINSTIKRTLYLCTRESLQNTIKYAEASQFLISFSTEKKQLILHVKDNGKGFGESPQKKGIGLKNLKERVEEIGGSFDIETNEKGTRTSVRIPMNGG